MAKCDSCGGNLNNDDHAVTCCDREIERLRAELAAKDAEIDLLADGLQLINESRDALVDERDALKAMLKRIVECWPNHHLAPDFVRDGYALLEKLAGKTDAGGGE